MTLSKLMFDIAVELDRLFNGQTVSIKNIDGSVCVYVNDKLALYSPSDVAELERRYAEWKATNGY